MSPLFNTDRSGETNSIQVSLTPAAQCTGGFEPCDEWRLAEQKSPVKLLRPLNELKSWYFGELWHFYPTRIQIRLYGAQYAVRLRHIRFFHEKFLCVGKT